MIPEITNQNLYLLLPSKAALFAKIYKDKHGGTVQDALRAFYKSKMYKELEQEETKLWHYGPVALYEEFEERQ
ncbi:MAG: hypothetical protein LBN24_10870 [Mediterranea sp.]|jgi:hypothetical protein|nr:hypothetical protein [Mediterranea sp.]